MTLYSVLFADDAILVGRKYFKTPGQVNYTVPAGATVCRAVLTAAGGQGENWGGSAALVKEKFGVTPGENLKLQVGDTQTATTLGDSWIKRNDGTLIAYADRGRGNTNKGLASNSTGAVRRDGANGVDATPAGGLAPSDGSDTAPLGFGGLGSDGLTAPPADFGGGGHNTPQTDPGGVFFGYSRFLAGTGLICLEFFDIDPGYL